MVDQMKLRFLRMLLVDILLSRTHIGVHLLTMTILIHFPHINISIMYSNPEGPASLITNDSLYTLAAMSSSQLVTVIIFSGSRKLYRVLAADRR
ncbi:hypothetical protein GGU10DRAFT_346913 [Lentinula aff. detonsa]|uniref:Uncharacterized protein n=1 Tax=Lentinula aff. detonsa TaxID=2804958 RepID=A0AA38NQ42_9AGAR|nr:hypothetical protein GGU10DRAFT_346913 [Lentinula aff. detonsa]